MNPALLPGIAAALLAGAAAFALAVVGLRAYARRRYLARAAAVVAGVRPREGGLRGAAIEAAETVGRAAAPYAPAKWRERAVRTIADAGLAFAPERVLGAKLLAPIVAFLLAGGATQSAALGLLAAAGAFFLPDLWLSERANARKKSIRRGLPDMLDLLTLSVEAGLGLDQSCARFVEKAGPSALRDEIERWLREVRMGRQRHEALGEAAARTGVPEFAAFASALASAERMGAPIGATLRAQADQLRLRRAQSAERTAQEMPVKMLAPLMLLLLPAVFLILLGPIVLRLVQ